MMMVSRPAYFCLFLACLLSTCTASPVSVSRSLRTRTEPFFPSSPPSCPLCQQNWQTINSCASAASVFQNYEQILFNPASFVDVIQCSCTDTFQSAFPQCVDCFQFTNQTDVLVPNQDQTDELPSILTGMRQICALASTLLGNVTNNNKQGVNQTPITVASPQATSGQMAPPMVGWATWIAVALSVMGVSLL